MPPRHEYASGIRTSNRYVIDAVAGGKLSTNLVSSRFASRRTRTAASMRSGIAAGLWILRHEKARAVCLDKHANR